MIVSQEISFNSPSFEMAINATHTHTVSLHLEQWNGPNIPEVETIKCQNHKTSNLPISFWSFWV